MVLHSLVALISIWHVREPLADTHFLQSKIRFSKCIQFSGVIMSWFQFVPEVEFELGTSWLTAYTQSYSHH